MRIITRRKEFTVLTHGGYLIVVTKNGQCVLVDHSELKSARKGIRKLLDASTTNNVKVIDIFMANYEFSVLVDSLGNGVDKNKLLNSSLVIEQRRFNLNSNEAIEIVNRYFVKDRQMPVQLSFL